jgi:hypothetical protein
MADFAMAVVLAVITVAIVTTTVAKATTAEFILDCIHGLR